MIYMSGRVDRSRSLKMAPFDTSYTTFYWSVTVNVALSCGPYRCWVIWRWIISWRWNLSHSKSIKLVPFESLGAVSYSPYIVTMVENWSFAYPLALDAPIGAGSSCRNIAIPFGTEELELWGYLTVKQIWGCVAYWRTHLLRRHCNCQ